jgi:WG containing repeat
METKKKSSLATWKLALVGAGTSIGIAVVGLGVWYLSTKVLPDISSSSGSKKPSDGLFRITDSAGKYGFIDKTGKVVISPQFDSVGYFHEGLAQMRMNNTIGYIDKEGKIAINPQFDQVNNFSEGVAFVKIGSKWGVIDKEGKVAINPQFDFGFQFSEGLAAVQIGKKWGYIDKKGQLIIQPTFDRAGLFEDGLAEFKSEKDSKLGYIDKKGKVVIQAKLFDQGFNFSEGLATVKLGDKWGYINKKGVAEMSGDKFRFDTPSSRNSDYLSMSTYSQGEGAFSEGLAAVTEKGKKVYINKNGQIVIGFQIDNHSKFSEGLAHITIGDKCGYIDKVGKIVINPQFKTCGPFSQDLAPVSTSDLTGYIDKSGKYVWQRGTSGSNGG